MERNTIQRRAVQRTIQEADRPLSPEEILAEGKRYCPTLGIATVYRTVKEFLADGWISPVRLPGDAARYEIAGKTHHHYFYCHRCARTSEVRGCPDGLHRLTPSGFKLEDHEVVLYGTCASCVREVKEGRKRK